MKINEALLWKITLASGIIAAFIGVMLRFYFVAPAAYTFKNVLHAHSHLMLLGWLFQALLLLLYRYWQLPIPRSHALLMGGMSLCVAGMLFSFPFQGYAAVSISFSTLHLWLSYVLLIKIWRHFKGRGLAIALLRSGIIMFFLSSLGPYALGPLMANDMQSSPWYQQAIFFYLHFQYNGAFLLFALALIAKKWLNNQSWPWQAFLWLFVSGAVLTWAHSLDYSFDAFWINLAGGAGAFLQVIAGIMLFRRLAIKRRTNSQLLLLAILALKLVFQLLGSLPEVADAVAGNRFYLIAWLHFIFLGFFTPFIWSHFHDHSRRFSALLMAYWLLFLATEVALTLPSLYYIEDFVFWPHLTFALYALLAIVWAALLLLSWRKLPIPVNHTKEGLLARSRR